MAEHVLNTRLLLRYDTYSNWMNSSAILKQGEAAVAVFPTRRSIENTNISPENTPPAIGIKIGDGFHRFDELPWVQAVAADVYNWAKQSYKPTYTAQEIEGLQSYVESLVGSDVEVTIAPRVYQLIAGTGENQYKYYLRYKENNEDGQWVVDTSSYIDLEDLNNIAEWLGRENVAEYPNLITRNAEQIRYFLNNLNAADTAQDGKFVTSVSQNAGIVTVERAQLNFSDFAGTAAVEQGGTGRTALTENHVLVGNGTDMVQLVPIAESIATNDYLVPNYLVKQYVDNATAGITGAMHFIGEATVVISNNSSVDPHIGGYTFANAEPGDVILYDAKEYVWTGGNWRLLGDEGSYAVKGSITNIDIAEDAEISQSKIAQLSDTFNTKVDKEEGKVLTSNDFTDELKQKLENLLEDAQINTIEHILLNGIEIAPATVGALTKAINLQVQEFDSTAQAKLAEIENAAQVNKIDKIIYDGTEILPDTNKIITITPDPHTEHINKIEQIYVNGTEYIPDANKAVKITLDPAALNLSVIEGAYVPSVDGGVETVDINNKYLNLSRMAKTGNISDLAQTNDTYIILDCGTSTEVI